MSYVFNPFTGNFDITSSQQNWLDPVANSAALPASGNTSGDVRVALDTGIAYEWSGSAWNNLVINGISPVTATEIGYVHGVTSAIQTQLNATEKTANKGVANGYAGLDSGGKVPFAQLPSTLMIYLGAWDASTNTPTLTDGTGANGDTYRVSVAGTQNLGSGSQTFFVGDFIIYNGTIWQRSPAADGVISVNSATGAVTVNAINQLTGDVTAGPASGSQSQAATIAANAVTNTKLAQMAAHTYKGNNTGSIANASDITSTQLTADLNQFTSSLQGVVPSSGGGTTNFLRADGTWVAAPGTGANTTLSNLGTTAVNASINPSLAESGLLNLGDATHQWGKAYIGSLTDTTGQDSVRAPNRTLRDNTSGVLLDWGSVANTVFIQHQLALNNASNAGGYLQMSVGGASVTPYSILWPSAQGTGALNNDGSGNLTWSTVSLSSGVTGVLPVANGGTGVSSVTTSPTASSFSGWDANSNLSANNFLPGYTTTVTAAATTTLTVSSTEIQVFTGTTTQTVTLPATSTLVLGQRFCINNLSTGIVTVKSSGANTLQALPANSQLLVTCISTSGTGTASWSWTYHQLQGPSDFWNFASNTVSQNTFLTAVGTTNANGATLAVSDLGSPALYLSGVASTNKIVFNNPGVLMGCRAYKNGANNTVLSFGTTVGASTNVSDILTVLNTGNVGIGTNAPGSALEVSGTVTATTLSGSLAATNITGQVAAANGGTGVNNSGTLTYGSNNITLTTTGVTSVTLPTSGTLATSGTGDISETSFSAANNQSAAANVTGFSFASASVGSFRAQVQVYVNATTPLKQMFTIQGSQTGAGGWQINSTSVGDETGFVFTITSAGQIQYVSNNYTGFVSATVKFRALGISV